MATTLLLLSLALPISAQEATRAGDPGPAWLGVTYDLRWVEAGSSCASHALVDGVIPGSPAERAGVRPGDVVVAIDGDRDPARTIQMLSLRLAPGDPVRLLLHRAGSVREVTAVAERRPDRPPALLQRSAVPGRGRDAPVIHLRGDTLVASNIEARAAAVRSRTPGYWLSREDGRTIFRPLGARPVSELDRRVASLLACVDAAGSPLPALQVRAEQIQERAESLRVVIARRALEHRQGEVPSAPFGPPTPGFEMFAGRDAMILRAGDALAASLRGVVGADVVAMEPELAAYFRGVDTGLLVLRVAQGSAAQRAGLRPGDVITSAAGRAVATPADLLAALGAPGTGTVDLAIVRQGGKRTVSLSRP